MALRDPSILTHTLSDGQREVVRELAALLHASYGPKLVELKLVGSRARGDAVEESDVDVLVVVDVSGAELAAETQRVWSLAAAVKQAHPDCYLPLSLLVFGRGQFETMAAGGERLPRDAAVEGIPL